MEPSRRAPVSSRFFDDPIRGVADAEQVTSGPRRSRRSPSCRDSPPPRSSKPGKIVAGVLIAALIARRARQRPQGFSINLTQSTATTRARSSSRWDRYRLDIAGPATRALPPRIAAAAYAFITRPLLDNPRRVGKQLEAPLAPAWSARWGAYRILYLIDDERAGIVKVTAVRHRSDTHRT